MIFTCYSLKVSPQMLYFHCMLNGKIYICQHNGQIIYILMWFVLQGQLLRQKDSCFVPVVFLQLSLPEGVTVDIIVSSVVAPNHVFVQQPTHAMYPLLDRQNQCMLLCYNQDGIVPQLPRPLEGNAPHFFHYCSVLVILTKPPILQTG